VHVAVALPTVIFPKLSVAPDDSDGLPPHALMTGRPRGPKFPHCSQQTSW